MKKNKKKRLRRIGERTHERRATRIKEKIHGILAVTANGYGFVRPEGAAPDAEEIFIPAQYINGALNGDEVLVAVLPPREEDIAAGRGGAGKVLEVLTPGRDTIVGELINGHRLRPLNKRMPEELDVAPGTHGAKRGDWVEVRLLRSSNENEEFPRAKIIKKIGTAGTVQGDLDAVCAEFDLPKPYSEEDDAQAIALEIRPMIREDWRKLPTLTIDPEDAKDFDDALSIHSDDAGNWVVGVHIADVAAWIAPHSHFDKQAGKRGFTAYLPGRTLPMLPKSLTARISMQADQDSPAHSVFFTVEPETGNVLSTRRAHTTVHVANRLNYDQVQEFFDHDKLPARCSAEALDALRRLDRIARLWRAKREKTEGFLHLEIPEIRVRCDEASDTISGLERKIQRESEELVEEYMLAANVAVARELIERAVPGLFRIHQEPDPLKLEEFSGLCQQSFGLGTGDLNQRENVRAFLAALPDDPRKPILLSAFLRSLPRAAYSETPSLHYGLGKLQYSHFTSPIRRYPDLAVHQQLWNFDSNSRLRAKSTMEKFAADISAKEMNNDDAYYTANDRLKLRYLADKAEADPSAKFYEGVVAKVLNNGLLVDIAELGIYGFVPLDNFNGSYHRSGRKEFQEKSANPHKVGDYLYLTLSHIDFARGNAVFTTRN